MNIFGPRKFTPDEDATILAEHAAGRWPILPGRERNTVRGRLHLLLERRGETLEPLWRKWSHAELLTCWKLHLAGNSNAHVAAFIGRSEKAVKAKVEQIQRGDVPNPEDRLNAEPDDEDSVTTVKMTDRQSLSESAKSPAQRKCLRCGSLFNSGHAGNRICQRCTKANREVGLSANFNNAESWG